MLKGFYSGKFELEVKGDWYWCDVTSEAIKQDALKKEDIEFVYDAYSEETGRANGKILEDIEVAILDYLYTHEELFSWKKQSNS